MIIGKKYRVTHQSDLQRFARESVMVYLGKSKFSDEHQFSARPLAGTQTLTTGSILKSEEVPEDTPVSMNKRLELH